MEAKNAVSTEKKNLLEKKNIPYLCENNIMKNNLKNPCGFVMIISNKPCA